MLLLLNRPHFTVIPPAMGDVQGITVVFYGRQNHYESSGTSPPTVLLLRRHHTNTSLRSLGPGRSLLP